jgi:hypothetical protein
MGRRRWCGWAAGVGAWQQTSRAALSTWYGRTGSMQLQRTAYRVPPIGPETRAAAQDNTAWALPRHRGSVAVSPSGRVARRQ